MTLHSHALTSSTVFPYESECAADARHYSSPLAQPALPLAHNAACRSAPPSWLQESHGLISAQPALHTAPQCSLQISSYQPGCTHVVLTSCTVSLACSPPCSLQICSASTAASLAGISPKLCSILTWVGFRRSSKPFTMPQPCGAVQSAGAFGGDQVKQQHEKGTGRNPACAHEMLALERAQQMNYLDPRMAPISLCWALPHATKLKVTALKTDASGAPSMQSTGRESLLGCWEALLPWCLPACSE